MAEHNCETCKFRAKYEKAPKSLLGRVWHWHTGFCPGWRKYFLSQDIAKQNELREKYKLKLK